MQTILLVDPETDFLEWAQNQLETPITRVVTSTTADEAYKIYIAENPDLLISETHLMPFSGLGAFGQGQPARFQCPRHFDERVWHDPIGH